MPTFFGMRILKNVPCLILELRLICNVWSLSDSPLGALWDAE